MVAALSSLPFAKGKPPSQEDQESVARQIASLFAQAQAIGRAHAQDEQSRALAWSAGKNPLAAAWNVVSNFVDRITSWFRSQDTESISEDDVEAEVENLAETVAGTEVASVIEQEVLDALQEQGVLSIVWIAQDGACPTCQANADQGAIPIGSDFESGDAKPPAHPRCRCSLGMP